jgi:hypothetical protein
MYVDIIFYNNKYLIFIYLDLGIGIAVGAGALIVGGKDHKLKKTS